MGRKNISNRETKKAKKGTKLTTPPSLAPILNSEPEIVRKKKSTRGEG